MFQSTLPRRSDPGGIAWTPTRGTSGALRVRRFGAYPLTEDNTIRANPATLLNATAGYTFASRVRLEAAVLNLLDSRASDIQYYDPSQLQGEPEGGGAERVFPRSSTKAAYYRGQEKPVLVAALN